MIRSRMVSGMRPDNLGDEHRELLEAASEPCAVLGEMAHAWVGDPSLLPEQLACIATADRHQTVRTLWWMLTSSPELVIDGRYAKRLAVWRAWQAWVLLDLAQREPSDNLLRHLGANPTQVASMLETCCSPSELSTRMLLNPDSPELTRLLIAAHLVGLYSGDGLAMAAQMYAFSLRTLLDWIHTGRALASVPVATEAQVEAMRLFLDQYVANPDVRDTFIEHQIDWVLGSTLPHGLASLARVASKGGRMLQARERSKMAEESGFNQDKLKALVLRAQRSPQEEWASFSALEKDTWHFRAFAIWLETEAQVQEANAGRKDATVHAKEHLQAFLRFVGRYVIFAPDLDDHWGRVLNEGAIEGELAPVIVQVSTHWIVCDSGYWLETHSAAEAIAHWIALLGARSGGRLPDGTLVKWPQPRGQDE